MRTRLSRREAMKWVVAVAATAAVEPETFAGVKRMTAVEAAASSKGYGTDPDLTKIYKPGEVWPLTFTDDQLDTVEALCDTILPKDQYGPAASDLGVPDMIDEWISAPYPSQQHDRPVVLEGLVWIEAESKKRFSKGFAGLSDAQKRAICDDICHRAEAKPEFKKAAGFFNKFRDLCARAYYSTPPGWRAVGYVGNMPLTKFDGPPPEVLERLGVTQTVK